jgi:adenine-specific DNA-methyltransferase
MNKNYMRSPVKKSTSATSRDGFSAHTQDWLEKANVSDRRALGQYMTPEYVRDKLLDSVELKPSLRVLDPSVGTGEFLRAAEERCPGMMLTGWDIDTSIARIAEKNAPSASIVVRDALSHWDGDNFDLIIGNPPYFQFDASPELREAYAPVISGRPNIFAMFFMASLSVLSPNGVLAFVVPTSMNTGAYFENLRNYLLSKSSIEHLEILSDSNHFLDAQTSVQILVLRNGAQSNKYVFRREELDAHFSRVMFTLDPNQLDESFAGAKTIWDLGFVARTGTVVWNQNKHKLHMSPGIGSTRLLWAHDITSSGEISRLPLEGKPAWISGVKPLYGPALIVNRIVGSVGKAQIRVAVVPEGLEFVAENHVNVIAPREGVNQQCSLEDLRTILARQDTAAHIAAISGNTQLSATEINHLMPIRL